MGNDVYVAGIGMTRFSTHMDRTCHELCAEALDKALGDGGLGKEEIQCVFFSNSFRGRFEGRHCIRGQCALRPYGLLGPPIVNVENASASGSTGLYMGYLALKSGEYDVALCLGVEKIAHPDKSKSFSAYTGEFDRTDLEGTLGLYEDLSVRCAVPMPPDDGQGKSPAMETCAVSARWHMSKFGTTQEHLAKIAVKNRFNGSLNPLAHWRQTVSLEAVMGDRLISYPITRSMCSPIGDGAAAVILVSERYRSCSKGGAPVRVRAMAHASGQDKRDMEETEDIGRRAAAMVYEKAGLGPEDVDIAEVHDATAYGELYHTECLGFTPEGMGGEFVELGKSTLDGDLPINPSGGLISRGHPIGATGLAQIHELVIQLRHKAGRRQVPKDVRIALAENGGGILTLEEASMTITILEKI